MWDALALAPVMMGFFQHTIFLRSGFVVAFQIVSFHGFQATGLGFEVPVFVFSRLQFSGSEVALSGFKVAVFRFSGLQFQL